MFLGNLTTLCVRWRTGDNKQAKHSSQPQVQEWQLSKGKKRTVQEEEDFHHQEDDVKTLLFIYLFERLLEIQPAKDFHVLCM